MNQEQCLNTTIEALASFETVAVFYRRLRCELLSPIFPFEGFMIRRSLSTCINSCTGSRHQPDC